MLTPFSRPNHLLIRVGPPLTTAHHSQRPASAIAQSELDLPFPAPPTMAGHHADAAPSDNAQRDCDQTAHFHVAEFVSQIQY
jgi:hypothetical protein